MSGAPADRQVNNLSVMAHIKAVISPLLFLHQRTVESNTSACAKRLGTGHIAMDPIMVNNYLGLESTGNVPGFLIGMATFLMKEKCLYMACL